MEMERLAWTVQRHLNGTEWNGRVTVFFFTPTVLSFFLLAWFMKYMVTLNYDFLPAGDIALQGKALFVLLTDNCSGLSHTPMHNSLWHPRAASDFWITTNTSHLNRVASWSLAPYTDTAAGVSRRYKASGGVAAIDTIDNSFDPMANTWSHSSMANGLVTTHQKPAPDGPRTRLHLALSLMMKQVLVKWN